MCLGRICPALGTQGGWTEAEETPSPNISLQSVKPNNPPLEGSLENVKEVPASNPSVASKADYRKLLQSFLVLLGLALGYMRVGIINI